MRTRILYFLILAASLCASAAYGQPIPDEQYQMRVGNTFTLIEIEIPDLATVPLGAAQTWDFSATGTGQLTGASILAASQGTAARYFPAADAIVRISSPFGNFDAYVANSALGSYSVGTYGGGRLSFYSAPGAGILHGTLRYGQTLTNFFTEKAVVLGGSDTTFFQVREEVSYVGYGSILLPFSGAFSNVILFQTKARTEQANTSAGPFAVSDSSTRYAWYAPGVGYPVANLEAGVFFDGINWSPSNNGFMLTGVTVGNAPNVPADLVGLSPMPARSQVQLLLPEGENATSVRITDAAGREIPAPALQNNQMDVRSLAPGAYWIEIQGKKTYRARLLKE